MTVADGKQGEVRLMGLHERYSLARQNLGFSHTILHIITYPAAALPSQEFLESRVNELQERLPMLHARFADLMTNHPGYVEGDVWPVKSIVRDMTFTPASGDDEALGVYLAELKRFSALDLNTEPAWAVTRATSPGAERAYLLMAFAHPIIDGKGSSLMVRALTAENTDYIKAETWDGPTRCDDTVSLKPSISFLLPIAFRELLLPNFPRFIQRPFLHDPWPEKAVTGSVIEAPENISVISINADLTAKAKAVAKQHNVATLHPLIKAAWIVAMWHAYHDGPDFLFTSSTARSERDVSLGHAAITHNYVSATEWGRSLSGQEKFWDIAREAATNVSSPQAISNGRMLIGLLAHIPDPEVNPTANDFDPKQPTGWEKHFYRRAVSEEPYRESAAFSNLGFYPLPPGATDSFWGQTASPFGAAFGININGHEGGIRATAGFRDGVVADKKKTDQIQALFHRIIERVAAGETDNLTLEQITA